MGQGPDADKIDPGFRHSADSFYIHITSEELDFWSEDNFFTMLPDTRKIEIRLLQSHTRKEVKEKIKVSSLYDLICWFLFLILF